MYIQNTAHMNKINKDLKNECEKCGIEYNESDTNKELAEKIHNN